MSSGRRCPGVAFGEIILEAAENSLSGAGADTGRTRTICVGARMPPMLLHALRVRSCECLDDVAPFHEQASEPSMEPGWDPQINVEQHDGHDFYPL